MPSCISGRLFCFSHSSQHIENMELNYIKSAVQLDFSARAFQSLTEEKEYAVRLREVENALLCQAFGGQMPQPGSQQRLQRYLNGEISRAEAFQPVFYPVS
jgi:predicted flavoprotein YhiN